MTTEKLIERIQNLLDLAGNNPNEHEAMAAALKAQELMAKYNITIAQVDGVDRGEEIVEEVSRGTRGNETLRTVLAEVVACNFCCKVWFQTGGVAKSVVFYGYKKDAEIARRVFEFLYSTAMRMAGRYRREKRKEGTFVRGDFTTYLLGFAEGVRRELEKQCTALQVVVPQEVVQSFEEVTAGFRTKNFNPKVGTMHAFSAGESDGRDVAQARGLEASA